MILFLFRMLQLDAKKSPLALLAQTCSQIGTDAPNTKSVLNSSSSSDGKLSKNQREKSSPSSSSNGSSPVTSKSSFKPYESCLKSSDTKCVVADEKKSSPTRLPSSSSIVGSAQTSQDTNHSSKSVCSPSSSPGTRRTPVSQQDAQPGSRPQSNPTSVVTSSPSLNAAKTTTSDPISSLKSLSLPAVSSAHNYIPNYPSLPLDVMVSSLLSSHHMKAGMHPYLNYNRLKTATAGADSGIMPLCRDPYCSSCQLSSHILAASAQNGKSCPPGCTQCDIGKSSANHLLSGGHGTTLAAAYAQAQLAALAAASQMPHVCSWVGGDATYCGKRFLTSEELLQHLRTHTSSETLLNMSAHSLLNRTYPTPPLSPLSTARYHPYSKPPFLTPSSLFPLQPNPAALHPGFSPYLFYNAKLGSTPHH